MKLLRVSLTCAGLLLALSLQASTTRVYITNAAGDSVHVIDPVTNKVIEEIKGCEIPSGVDFSPDGKRVYLDCEGDQTGGRSAKKASFGRNSPRLDQRVGSGMAVFLRPACASSSTGLLDQIPHG